MIRSDLSATEENHLLIFSFLDASKEQDDTDYISSRFCVSNSRSLLLLGRSFLYRAKAAYSHEHYLQLSVGLCVCVSGCCLSSALWQKRLIGYGRSLGW